jgi:GT2 family glycosyltransferase
MSTTLLPSLRERSRRPLAFAPAVSVCIVNWNCREILRKCLLSLFEQEQGVAFEVVVVDNDSTDGAPDMVAEEFPQVELVRNRHNIGFSHACNQAARLAEGEYLFFLNNDTEVGPHTLAGLFEYAEAHPEAKLIGPKLHGSDGNPQISYRQKPTIAAMLNQLRIVRWTRLFRSTYHDYRRGTFRPQHTGPVEILLGAAVFLSRETFDTLGGWDERYRFGLEDIDLSTEAGKLGDVVYLSEVEVLHHGRMSSRGNIRFALPNVTVGYAHYFRKHAGQPLALFLYKLLVTLDAPFQLVFLAVQCLVRKALGRTRKAEQSGRAALGIWHFLRRDCLRFWRA